MSTKTNSTQTLKKPAILAKKLGLTFNQPSLFVQALTHRSAGSQNNERLEYLGDAVLGFVIAHQLYVLFPRTSEGNLSRLRAHLVNQSALANLARDHNIGDYLLMGHGELKNGGYKRDSILSDALEAIIGSVLEDQDIKTCEDWVVSLFSKKLVSLDLDRTTKDAKTKLQELMQSQKTTLPSYTLIKTSGNNHTPTFDVQCTVSNSHQSFIGSSTSIKKAEQIAASKMLQWLNTQTA